MQRETVRIPEETISRLEARVDEGEFETKSHAVRTAVFQLLGDDNPHETALLLSEQTGGRV